LAAPPQTPLVQLSAVVQRLLSSQLVPFAAIGFEQAPLTVSQTPAAWQVSVAAQMWGEPWVQIPARHWSPVVQALPSLQEEPSTLMGVVH